MIFKWRSESDQVIIKAFPENNSELVGYRAEAPYPKIWLKLNGICTYSGRKYAELVFKYNINSNDANRNMVNENQIHPDMLGLLCILSFYPFIRDSITFPLPVSPHFAKVIQELKFFTVDQKTTKYIDSQTTVNILNINVNLRRFQPGPNKAIAYGGGLDSTATLAMFQDAYIIHEQRIGYDDRTGDFMQKLEENWSKWHGKTFLIKSNNKDLTSDQNGQPKAGWTTWVSCLSTSILLATQLDLGVMMTGSSLGSSYLSNGRFIKVHQLPKNEWTKLFEKIGLYVFSPIAGLSEIALGKVILQTYPEWLDQISYCINGKDGGNCHKCQKCFRRQMIIAYLQGQQLELSRYQKFLNKIENEHQYKNRLGPSLNYVLDNNHNIWINKHYGPSLNLVPANLQQYCQQRIYKYIDKMTEQEEHMVEQTKYE